MEKQKILLLGDNLRSAVSVSETLTRNGFEVHVLGWWGIPLAKSKWIAAYHCIPRWDQHIEKGQKQFQEILQKYHFRALIPVNDDALEIGARFEELISKNTAMIGFPEKDQWQYARDKSVLLAKFESLGLGGPESVLIDSVEKFQEQDFTLAFPLIVKPSSSRQMKEQTLYTNSVRKISSQEEWNSWKSGNPVFPVMIQEYIGGRELGFNFYAENGEIIHCYIDEQLHGRIGNEASYRSIAKLTETQQHTIFDVFERFVRSVSWDGMGMFDFKFDRDRVFIIEFNGRFWASIQLSKISGSDLTQIFVNRKLLEIPLEEIELKPPGKGRIRNLKADFVFALKLLKNREFKTFFRWIGSLRHIFSSSEYIEDSFFRDINFRFHIFKWHFTNFVRR